MFSSQFTQSFRRQCQFGGAALRRHGHTLHQWARLLRGLPQVVGALHAQPQLRTGVQQVRQAQRHIGRNADVPMQDAHQDGELCIRPMWCIL